MRTKTAIEIMAAFCLLFLFLGFYANKNINPQELGFFRAQVDDDGLIELAVDQIREAVKTGNAQSLRSLMVDSFSENRSVEDGSSQNLSKTTAVEASLAFVERMPRPDLHLKTRKIEIEGERATVHGFNSESGLGFELTFVKKNKQWKLAHAKGLFANLEKTSQIAGSSLQTKNDAASFKIYSEGEHSENKTLIWQPISTEHGINRMTKSITLEKIDRQLFNKPYAGVLFSSVTQLTSAPYFSARYVQLVTDPGWNRIVYGDYEGWLKAYGNADESPEALNHPHGIDRDAEGNVYVADTGNNRIVVLKLAGSGEATELEFQFDFGATQLMHPYDVAWDDRSTPFESADDIIWVADTGHHRILGYALNNGQASVCYIFGEQGKEEGAFFEPKGLAIARFNGVSDGGVYVADTGNRRIVKLRVLDNRLEWLKAYRGKDESQFTSLDVDHWGNVYTADRSYREIHKLSSQLQPLAKIKGEDDSLLDPLNFQIVFGKVFIESENRQVWSGYDQAFAVEKWSERSGGERFQLGLDLEEFEVGLSEMLDEMRIQAKLTDHAQLSLTVIDAETQATVRQIPQGWMIPGDKEILWDRRNDIGWQVEPGFYRLQLSAESSYGKLTVLKETPDFYLPLYYREDSGAEVHHDAHLIQGVRSTEWGTAPQQSIVKHPSEVIYRFTDLNPTVDYEISAEFTNAAGNYLKQRITVDGATITPDFELPSGILSVDWTQLPGETYGDGEIELSILKTGGEGEAMVSQLWLRETNYDPANAPTLRETSSEIPKAFTLSQNYPNPFNPTTTIEFGVPAGTTEKVTLKIYNMLGQTVKVLVDEQLAPGRHAVVWNGRDASERPISSGVYLYRLTAGDFVEVKKLILMK